MSAPQTARDVDFENASTSLSEGLETCRELVLSYRRILAGDPEILGDERFDHGQGCDAAVMPGVCSNANLEGPMTLHG